VFVEAQRHADGTMLRNDIFDFLRIGTFLERADSTARILDVKYFMLLPELSDVGTAYDEVQWAALLKSASAFEMYRKRWGLIVPSRVVAFLTLDRSFPRSMRYCVNKAERSLHAITGNAVSTASSSAERTLGRLRAELEFVDADELIAAGLHERIDGFQGRLNAVGDAVYETN